MSSPAAGSHNLKRSTALIVGHAIHAATQIILQSRVAFPDVMAPDPARAEFNLMSPDVYLPELKKFVDDFSQPLYITLSFESPPARPSVVERWRIAFEQQISGSAKKDREVTPEIMYRNAAVLLRVLHGYLCLLPCHSLCRALRRNRSSPARLTFSLDNNESSSQLLLEPFKQQVIGRVGNSLGTFVVTVLYRPDIRNEEAQVSGSTMLRSQMIVSDYSPCATPSDPRPVGRGEAESGSHSPQGGCSPFSAQLEQYGVVSRRTSSPISIGGLEPSPYTSPHSRSSSASHFGTAVAASPAFAMPMPSMPPSSLRSVSTAGQKTESLPMQLGTALMQAQARSEAVAVARVFLPTAIPPPQMASREAPVLPNGSPLDPFLDAGLGGSFDPELEDDYDAKSPIWLPPALADDIAFVPVDTAGTQSKREADIGAFILRCQNPPELAFFRDRPAIMLDKLLSTVAEDVKLTPPNVF